MLCSQNSFAAELSFNSFKSSRASFRFNSIVFNVFILSDILNNSSSLGNKFIYQLPKGPKKSSSNLSSFLAVLLGINP